MAQVNRWYKDQESAYAKKVKVADYMATLPATRKQYLSRNTLPTFWMDVSLGRIQQNWLSKTLLKPDEISYYWADRVDAIFCPLVGNDIPRRVTYPANEQTLNS